MEWKQNDIEGAHGCINTAKQSTHDKTHSTCFAYEVAAF